MNFASVFMLKLICYLKRKKGTANLKALKQESVFPFTQVTWYLDCYNVLGEPGYLF